LEQEDIFTKYGILLNAGTGFFFNQILENDHINYKILKKMFLEPAAQSTKMFSVSTAMTFTVWAGKGRQNACHFKTILNTDHEQILLCNMI
jgi:hypothetical protein